MYSENDYRYYLAHGKWEWPNGKNSPAYNHDYYSKHKDKWKEYADKAKKKVKDVVGISDREKLDKLQKTYRQADKDVSETGYQYDLRRRNDDDGEWDNELTKKYNSYRAARNRLDDVSRQVSETAKHYRTRTIMGIAEEAYDAGYWAFNDALEKLKLR